MSRNEKRRMGIYVVTGIALVAVVAVLSVAVLKKRDSKNAQAQAANPSYMDENGGEYIAAFLKDMTDSTITVDIAEFITDDNTERIKELKLSEEDMPDGYYIYNPDEETVTWKLDGQTIYTFIDWNGNFTGSDYPEEYTRKGSEGCAAGRSPGIRDLTGNTERSICLPAASFTMRTDS